MALDRPIGPGQRHACFDRLIVVAESAGKALQGLQRPGGRALQPGLTRRWLPLADQGRTVLSTVDGLGDLGLPRASLGELLCLSRGAFFLASEDEPCRPAWCQRLARRLGHRRQGLVRASVPGRQALGLPQAAGRGRDQGAATVGRRSVQRRRRQAEFGQNHVRTRHWRRTRYAAQGTSASVRSS